MQVGEVQINGGGTQALMAENLLYGGQQKYLSAAASWRTSALSTRGIAFWEMRLRSVTRLTLCCTGRGPMKQRSFRAKYEIIRELVEIRIETKAALAP
jgi:hypothetical protein